MIANLLQIWGNCKSNCKPNKARECICWPWIQDLPRELRVNFWFTTGFSYEKCVELLGGSYSTTGTHGMHAHNSNKTPDHHVRHSIPHSIPPPLNHNQLITHKFSSVTRSVSLEASVAEGDNIYIVVLPDCYSWSRFGCREGFQGRCPHVYLWSMVSRCHS